MVVKLLSLCVYRVPKIAVVKSKGLSTQQLDSLQQDLLTKASSLKGEVMVFELSSIVQVLEELLNTTILFAQSRYSLSF